MPSCCIVPFCGNKIRGHIFPLNPVLRKKWIIAVRRKDWKPSAYSIVCHKHFRDEDYMTPTVSGQGTLRRLKPDAVPSLFRWTLFRNSTRSEQQALNRSTRAKKIREAKEMQDLSDAFIDTSTVAVNECEVITEDTDHDLKNDNDSVLKTHNTAVQTDVVPSSLMSIEKLMENDKAVLYYTGLESYAKFQMVLATLGPAAYQLEYANFTVVSISVENQFLLFLMKLRRHTPNFELALNFGVSETTVTNVFLTWLAFASCQWRELDLWTSRDLVRFHAPKDFKAKYPCTRVILDGTEIQVERPADPSSQRATFSTYKQRNTVKVVVGTSPAGLISHLSPVYGGSASDRQIIERSRLPRLCNRGDSIMVDKGFNVQDMFAPFDVKVNVPTFFSKKNRMTGESVLRDRQISSKRVHIERTIGLAKTFKILKGVLTTTETALADDIVFVCFMLCNFRDRIVHLNA